MRTMVLTGGVGGSGFLWGLAQELKREALTALVNTGDDLELHGLRISPNLDTVTYTLAECADAESGCGLAGDTFACLQLLAKYGQPTWARLGDRALATHIFRTHALRQGQRLTDVTDSIRRTLDVGVRILPMTDDPVGTYVLVGDGAPRSVHIQEYLAQRGAAGEVRGVEYRGSARARLTPEVLRALTEAETIFIAPSNPVVGIAPILAVAGVRKLLGQRQAPVVAISPVLGGRPLAGPTDMFLRWAQYAVSPLGVAQYYQAILGSLQGMVIDRADEASLGVIEALGIRVRVGEIGMRTPDGKRRTARLALALRESL